MAKESNSFPRGGVFLILGFIWGLIGFSPQTFIEDFSANISTELISIAITVLIIDYLYEQRQSRVLKEQLIREMGAIDKGIVHRAIRELRARGWLEDGSLIGADFSGANLSEANLRGANLTNAVFSGASLENANLIDANLEGAKLIRANLTNCKLIQKNLKGELSYAVVNIPKAKLYGANLYGADLTGADIAVEQIKDVASFEKAILPKDICLN